MIKILSLVFITSLAINVQAMEKVDAKYFELTKVKMTDVTEQYVGLIKADNSSQIQDNMVSLDNKIVPNLSLDPLDQVNISLDKIINIGQKIWAVIEMGRPVVNVQTNTANALPQGLRSWSDITGWQIPQSRVYRVQYENAYGMNVVDFAYRVVFTAGGSVNGQGKYITNATIMPANMNVSWGFTFNAHAEVPSVFNTGTKEQPIAGMQLLMKWSVDTVMSHIERAETFYVGGDNTMKHLE